VQTTSHLTHPNTVALYDYGHTAEGLFYYAMEYLDGISLRDLVARFGPLPTGRVVHILRQICGSLAEAHGLGLVHSDISPRNILLNRRGGLCDVVKVLDFGLVRDRDAVDHCPGGRVVAGSSAGNDPAAASRDSGAHARGRTATIADGEEGAARLDRQRGLDSFWNQDSPRPAAATGHLTGKEINA
jgi:eukaryotic-like serine/threonine-protein kinase